MLGILSMGLLPAIFPSYLEWTKPPISDGMRRRTQRRSIPDGFPHSPGENNILVQRYRQQLDCIDPGNEISATMEKRRSDASSVGDMKLSHLERKVLALLKKRKKEENLEGCSEAKLHEVWQPTFSMSERWHLFVCAPITLFYANVIVMNAVTAGFTTW